ncbi:hypothetical protein [Spiroplasma corruscae]|uniref:oxidoreductase n=1 Tax=Spiroplasma corruscae TaxID=216934 RepID=UPI003183255D
MNDFKAATIRAIKAGFDGIEIHGANTYLIQQFFSPHSNRRNDEFGGSIEKRFHFIDLLVNEIIKTIKENTKKEFIIGYRLSPEEYEEPGIKFEDTLFLVDKLSEKHIDYIHLSLTKYNLHSRSVKYSQKSMVDYIYKKINGRTMLVSVGSIRSMKDINNALLNSDLVAIGRPLLTDPYWVSKVENNLLDDIVTKLHQKDCDKLFINSSFYDFLTNRIDKD